MKNEEHIQAFMRHELVTKLELVYDGDFAPKFNSNRMLNTDLNTLGVSV